ncbi:MAG: YihY/virulence factor BrkB family protein, partial [Nitrospira sp.]
DWRWVTPGSVCAGSLWLLVSLAFKAYVEHFGNYNAAYGSIAGVIVLMLWLYLTGVVILLGGEINAQIQQAASSLRIRQEKAPQTVPAPAN